MVDFKIIYYVVTVMFALLISVFLWGFITYKKTKSETKFLNKPLFTLSIIVGSIGMLLTLIPIFLQIWTKEDEFIRSDPLFISLLVFEFVFLAGFLVLAYVFAFDFGIALDKESNTLQFFGQSVNTEKIVGMEEKKASLQVIYEQGFKNSKKKITIFTPKAKLFAQETLADIVSKNQASRQELAAQEAVLEQDVNLEANQPIFEDINTTSITPKTESKSKKRSK